MRIKIKVDFTDVKTLTPSWADEFITKLVDRFGNRVVLELSDNPSVKATLEFLTEIGALKFPTV